MAGKIAKTVFILGAGCSRSAGAPLMDNFLDVARELHARGATFGKQDAFTSVFEAIGDLQRIYAKANLDTNNLEAVFSTFEMGRLMRKFPGRDSEGIESLISDFRKVIVATLEATMKVTRSQNTWSTQGDYGRFVAMLSQIQNRELKRPHQVSVLSFNYDVFLDLELELNNADFSYCLDSPASLIGWDTIRLLKLHGSLNWGRKTESGEIVPIQGLSRNLSKFRAGFPEDRNWSGAFPVWSTLSKVTSDEGYEPDPFIVPPTWDKARHYEQLGAVWGVAAQELGTAENIIVIGFSMPEMDSFFRYLYALGSEGPDPLSRFLVFNPEPSIEKRFRSIIGQGAQQKFAMFSGDEGYFAKAISLVQGTLVSASR